MCSFYDEQMVLRMKRDFERMVVDYQNKGRYLGMDGKFHTDLDHAIDLMMELESIG